MDLPQQEDHNKHDSKRMRRNCKITPVEESAQ